MEKSYQCRQKPYLQPYQICDDTIAIVYGAYTVLEKKNHY